MTPAPSFVSKAPPPCVNLASNSTGFSLSGLSYSDLARRSQFLSMHIRERQAVMAPFLMLLFLLLRTAALFQSLGIFDRSPKSRLRYDKFDRNLRLAHEPWAHSDDSAEQFLFNI